MPSSISSAVSSLSSQLLSTQTQNQPSDIQSNSNPVKSFTDVLDSAAHDAINTGKVAEQQTALALSGKGNMSDVVSSIEEAKLTLQTTTALRDKFVGAYQEVMRMSI